MELDNIIINNFLSEKELKAFQEIASFKTLDIGGALIKVSVIANKVIEDKFPNKKVIVTFLRYNSQTDDTSFRIHSDGLLFGKRPKKALVVYIKGDNLSSGTAFFKHADHGMTSLDSIFMQDDGRWELDEFVPFEINKAVLYDSNKFHSRYPHKSGSERIVLVSFLE